MTAEKQTLQDAFDVARENFFAACDDKARKSELGTLCRTAWDARRAMAESGLFDAAEIVMTNDDLETISAITTLSSTPSPSVKEFYDKLAQKRAP